MKQQNVPPEDPEFARLHKILMVVQKHKEFQKERQTFAQQQAQLRQSQLQQQQQQQQQQNGTNGRVVANGINGKSPKACPLKSNTDHLAEGQASGPTGAAHKAPSSVPSSITPEQMNTLRNQIFAFKMLSKNHPIPPHVQQQLFASQRDKKPVTINQSVAAAAQVLDGATRTHQTKTGELPTKDTPDVRSDKTQTKDASEAPPSHGLEMYTTLKSPFESIGSTISYANHASRKARSIIPSLMPSGVDVDRVREDRERILYNRIMARRSDLENLPVNRVAWDTSKSDTFEVDNSLNVKARIELMMLRLLPKQRALRQQVSRDMIYYDNLAQTANRSAYRRMKQQTVRDARITEKLEKQQRDARESKEKKKQTDYLQSIILHSGNIQKDAASHKGRRQKLGRMMLSHHQTIEKEEQKRVERTAKQRLQALRANDEETYMKLLGQAKDSRISHLLKQTDGFLNQLAASVKAQQRSAADQYEDPTPPMDDEEASDSDEEATGPKIDYYQVAHRIKEDVEVQPKLLVGGTLKEYQLKGLQWMISLYNNKLNGILADEMGLGKTIQTISLITYLIENKRQHGPFLVIVPLSTLTNWNIEFEKWAPDVSRIVYKGTPPARKTQQAEIRRGQFQVLLTTYEYIIKDRPVLSKIRWVHMIVDEGHRMKNAQSKLSQTLTQYYSTRYRLILTGTPLQNNLPELWALLNFVLPNIFKSVKSFDEWFNTPFANTGGQDKMELTEEEQLLVIRRLHKVLRPFLLRRLKKDVEKDLPDKLEKVIKCRFSALQAKLYKQLVTYNKMAVRDDKGKVSGMRGLSNMLMQLRKLCNHPFVFEQVEDQMNPEKITNDLLWRTAGKFELLDRILPKFRASGHRVLMFFQMTQIMNIMEDFLRLRGLQYLRLDGSTKSDDRSELLAQFNAPNSPYFCFLLSTRAGGLGLNLQTADTVIIYDSDWNPHQDLQAQDRAHRIGQKNEVRILRLISSNSVEEKILERANYKLDMDGKVIQAGKFDNKSTNEEREALLKTLVESAEAAEQLAEQEEMDDDDLNDIMARSPDELEMFQRIDEDRARDDEYGPGRPLPRLMAESELPDIYLQEDNPVAEQIEEVAGRGAREKKTIKYDDGLTEEQWLQAVDDDEDTIEAAVERRNAQMEKRNANREKRAKKAAGLDSSPDPSRESSEAPTSKKRSRKPPPSKRKADDDIDDTPAAKRKRAARPSKAQDTLSSSERALLQKILNNVYEYLNELEEEIPGEPPDEDGDVPTRGLIDPFVPPVPKRDFPEYYVIIKHPICMQQIQGKINRHEYQSLREFRDNMRLLCNNARTFNEDTSLLFQDANTIEVRLLATLVPNITSTNIFNRLLVSRNSGKKLPSIRKCKISTIR